MQAASGIGRMTGLGPARLSPMPGIAASSPRPDRRALPPVGGGEVNHNDEGHRDRGGPLSTRERKGICH